MLDEEMELKLVGGLMAGGPTAYELVSTLLKAEDFSMESCGLVYRAMGELAVEEEEPTQEAMPYDLLLMKRQLMDSGAWNRVGMSMLAQLDGVLMGHAEMLRYAQALKKMAERRQMEANLLEMADATRNPEVSSAEIKAQMLETCDALEEESFEEGEGGMLGDILKEDPDMLAYCLGDKKQAGWVTGWHELDAIMHGVKPGDFVVVGGRPAEGKSVMGLNLAINMSEVNGIPTSFHALEMGEIETVQRISSSLAEVSHDKVKAHKLSALERKKVEETFERMKELNVSVQVPVTNTLSAIKGQITRDVRKHGSKVVVFDYLQMVESDHEREENRQALVSKLCRLMKRLARKLHICIIGMAQLNRESSKRDGHEGKRPQLTDLRESGELENNADAVWLIFRPERNQIKTMNNMSTAGKAILIVDKHRDGPVGEANLAFHESYRKFDNLVGPGLVEPPVQMRDYEVQDAEVAAAESAAADSAADAACGWPKGVEVPQGMNGEYSGGSRYYFGGS